MQEQPSWKGQFLKVEMRWSRRYSCQVWGSIGASMMLPSQPRQYHGEGDSKQAGRGVPRSMPGAPRLLTLARGLLGVGGEDARAVQATPSDESRVAFWEWTARGEPRKPRPMSIGR